MALGLKEPQQSLQFTTFWKLLGKVKSFKILTRFNKKTPLDAFLNSSEASGIARNCVKVADSALSYELHVFSMFWNIGRSIPSRLESFLNFLINSSKELTVLVQRTLAQLLRVVFVVVDLLELWITGLYCACT